MTKETSKILFEVMHVERWSFDIELFIIANKYGITCFEIPVNWEDVEGSKLNVF
jgi:dolichyl-phosphate beta-glucosyltransferase